MKPVVPALCFVVLGVGALGAQSTAQTTATETKSKIAVKGGKDVQVTGCIEPTTSGSGYMLTNAADKSGALHSYMLVTDDSDLSKHVGHRVQISGKAADQGDATVKTETKTKKTTEPGDEKETRSKSEVRGDLSGVPFLSVKSVKMIAASCP
jgi:hypothetical protein